MAGKIKDMSNVKQMLRLHQNGVSNRQIATELSVDKETVNRYVKRAKQDQLSIKELLKLDDPILQYRMSGGNPAYPDDRFEVQSLQLAQIKPKKVAHFKPKSLAP